VAKMSGIGCSSKTPAYFLSNPTGSTRHGRMPAISTGAQIANNTLITIGVSGDGDTASIGTGQFVHLLRRNIPMIYIRRTTACTADQGPVLRDGRRRVEIEAREGKRDAADRLLRPGDRTRLCVRRPVVLRRHETARRDPQGRGRPQGDLVPRHRLPVHDVQQPRGLDKSYKWARDHEQPLHEIGFVPFFEQIQADIKAGEEKDIEFPDGSHVRLKKVGDDYDPTNREQALVSLLRTRDQGTFMTGLLYVNPKTPDFCTELNMTDTPMALLPESQTRPPKAALEEIMERLT